MILVTGGTGLVGGNLLWYLLQENDRIKATCRKTSNLEPLKNIFGFYTSKPEEFLSRIDWIEADVLNEKSIANALENIDLVYHCAAVVSLGSANSNISEINVLGTKNIVNGCLKNKVSKLCFVSSIAACGSGAKAGIITEELEWVEKTNPSPYSQSKYDSEQEVWKGIKQGLNAVIVNPGVILGVSGTNSGSSELFFRVKKGLPFYTNGGSGYIDVRDVVKAMIELIKSDISGERFILVSENCSNKDILSWMAEGFGKSKPLINISEKTLYVIGYVSEKISVLLKTTPTIDRKIAKSASNRSYYSNEKIKTAINIQFKSMKEAIMDICSYIK